MRDAALSDVSPAGKLAVALRLGRGPLGPAYTGPVPAGGSAQGAVESPPGRAEDGRVLAASATLALARAARELAAGPPPDEVATVARQCVLDWVGVTLAGASEPLVGMLVDELGAGGPEEATLVGSGQ